MNEMIPSSAMWAGLAIFIAAAAFAIDFIFRRVFNRYSEAGVRFPHRVATELPRVLQRGDRYEAIELKEEGK